MAGNGIAANEVTPRKSLLESFSIYFDEYFDDFNHHAPAAKTAHFSIHHHIIFENSNSYLQIETNLIILAPKITSF
jgi:hypothetical protein